MNRRTFSARLAWLAGAALAGSAFPELVRAGARDSALDTDTDPLRLLARLEARDGGRLGVSVLDTGSGWALAHRADERFPMCSTFKWVAAAAVLSRVERGQDLLDRRIRYGAADLVSYSPVTQPQVAQGMTLGNLCKAAVVWSDNTAANLLLSTLGGPPGITAFARSHGDDQTRLDRIEPALNEAEPGDPRDTTTPQAMLQLLRRVVLDDGLAAPQRDQLASWLRGCRTGDTRLRAGFPPDWVVGNKTGAGAHGTNNDVAVIWPPRGAPIVVAAYLTNSPSTRDAQNALLAETARIVSHAVIQARLRAG